MCVDDDDDACVGAASSIAHEENTPMRLRSSGRPGPIYAFKECWGGWVAHGCVRNESEHSGESVIDLIKTTLIGSSVFSARTGARIPDLIAFF